MASILFRNINKLFIHNNETSGPLRGKDLLHLNSIDHAYLLVENEKIHSFGPDSEAPEHADEIINAEGKFVLPCWCDSHTHLVYAKSREQEFVSRIKGLSYEEIAAQGGGILNSAKVLQNTNTEELYESASARLIEIMKSGTGAVEIKSGYGLDFDSELKILHTIKKLKETFPVTIKSTFLGAHAYPEIYKKDHKSYLDLLINKLLPVITDEGLADFIDVFCETNYFSAEETDLILEAGVKHGLVPKIHVNQFNSIGGIDVAVKHKALTVDHLEVMSIQDYQILKHSDTIATILPSCSFFINIPYAPARKLIDHNIPVALASDFNPGSTPSGNIPFAISLACLKMNILPEEAINASTINGAFAMKTESETGSIAKNKFANIILTKKIPSIDFLPYAFGSDCIEHVWIKGNKQK